MNPDFVEALMKFRNRLLEMTGRIYGVHVIADSHVKIDGGVTTAHELRRRVSRYLEKR